MPRPPVNEAVGVKGRFEMVNVELAVGGGASATAGIAELLEGESLADLIRRADDNLYERRKQGGTSRRS